MTRRIVRETVSIKGQINEKRLKVVVAMTELRVSKSKLRWAIKPMVLKQLIKDG